MSILNEIEGINPTVRPPGHSNTTPATSATAASTQSTTKSITRSHSMKCNPHNRQPVSRHSHDSLPVSCSPEMHSLVKNWEQYHRQHLSNSTLAPKVITSPSTITSNAIKLKVNTKLLKLKRSALKLLPTSPTTPSLSIKSVKFKSEEFEELCYFSKETPPSDILLSPVYTIEDDLFDLSLEDPCRGKMGNHIKLSNFPPMLPFTLSGKQSRIDAVKLVNDVIHGSIQVKNLAYNKVLTVRYTLNDWKTFDESSCVYASSSPTEILLGGPPLDCAIDHFNFQIDIQKLLNEFHLVEKSNSTCLVKSKFISFAVRYECGDKVYWDNNDNKNYTIELKRSFIKEKAQSSKIMPSTTYISNNFKEKRVLLSKAASSFHDVPSRIFTHSAHFSRQQDQYASFNRKMIDSSSYSYIPSNGNYTHSHLTSLSADSLSSYSTKTASIPIPFGKSRVLMTASPPLSSWINGKCLRGGLYADADHSFEATIV